MLCAILPVLYLSVSFHPLGGHAKWPPHDNRRRSQGVIWLEFTLRVRLGRVALPYSRACVGCGRCNGGGAGESQEAGHVLGMLLSLGRSWPVMMCKQRLLKPFTLRITGSVSIQASDAYVSVVHAASWYVTSFSVVSTVTLQSRPQILERVDVLERNVADVHLAQQSFSCTPLCILHSFIGQPLSHQRPR